MNKIKPLGLLLYNNKAVNHRSVLKITLNPILRIFKWEIASEVEGNRFLGYHMQKCDRKINIFSSYYSSLFTCNEYDEVIK